MSENLDQLRALAATVTLRAVPYPQAKLITDAAEELATLRAENAALKAKLARVSTQTEGESDRMDAILREQDARPRLRPHRLKDPSQ